MEFSTYQASQLIKLLVSGEGIAALVGIILLLVVVTASKNGKWLVMAITIYISTLGGYGPTGSHFFAPISQLRDYGRTICGLLLFILLVPTLRASTGWRTRMVGGAITAYYVFEMVAATRQTIGGDPTRGLLGLLSFTLIYLVFAGGIGRWLQDLEDAETAITYLVFAGALFVGLSLVQYVIDPSQVSWAGRFLGMSDNANHCGGLLGTILIPCCYMLVRAPAHRAPFIRTLVISVFVALVICLGLWTGSRTFLLMAVTGVVVFFRKRLGAFTLAGAGVAVIVLLWLQFFGNTGTAMGHIVSLENTRNGPWQRMLLDFVEAPAFGKSWADASYSESSYLMVASRTGVAGLIPFFTAIALIAQSLRKVSRMRRSLGKHAALADLLLGGFACMAVGALFEGFFFSTFTIPVFAVYIYCSVVTFLIDWSASAPVPDPELEYEMGSWDEETGRLQDIRSFG